MRGCFPRINEAMRDRIEADFSIEETKNALRAMESLKAPGPDGYQPIFFKRTWEVTGTTLQEFTQRIIGGEEMPVAAAEVLPVLIPKEERPNSIRGF